MKDYKIQCMKDYKMIQTAHQDEVITAGGSHSPARLPTTVCYFHDEFYFLLMVFGDGGGLMQPRMALELTR